LVVLSLGKLWETYLYSSGDWDFSEFTIQPNSEWFNSDHYDLLSLNCFSQQNRIRIYSGRGFLKQLEKIKIIADFIGRIRKTHIPRLSADTVEYPAVDAIIIYYM